MGDSVLFENLRDQDFLTLEEVAVYLRCTEKTVRIATLENGLPCRKLGKRFVFSKQAVKEWFDAKERSNHAAKEKRQLGREMAAGWKTAE